MMTAIGAPLRALSLALPVLVLFLLPLAPTPARAQCQPRYEPTFGEAPGTNGTIEAMAVFDDGLGGGPALYAAGDFSRAGAHVGVGKIARWDGERWSPLGSGMDIQSVRALAVFDDGGGPALYAGGSFAVAGGVTVNGIAKWDGQNWHALGQPGSEGVSGFVWSLAVFDDGDGEALYVGGFFNSAGGVPANRIAKWDGQNWSAVGEGMAGGAGGQVRALEVFDDGAGGGPALYAAGSFLEADSAVVNRIAKWTGSSWVPLGDGGGLSSHVWDLAVWDDGLGGGPALYAAGEFISAGGVTVNRIARWDGQTWSPLGSGLNNTARTLLVFDRGDGNGPALCVGGQFTTAGGVTVNRIAAWDGQSWSPFTTGANGTVTSLIAYDAGEGEELYAAGEFIGVGTGFIVDHITRWDGERWRGLGGGLTNAVRAMAVHDDGAGASLFVGGLFVTGGDQPLLRMGRWDGDSWSVLAPGGMSNTTVNDLAVFDDGAGPALYAAGDFRTAGGVTVERIAKWDGQTWSPLGAGLGGIAHALAVWDDGTGPALYVGGQFTTAGGAPASRIAKWDGQTWTPLGEGTNQTVSHLIVFDDGTGPALYAAGGFTMAGGQPANRIAKWDGQNWTPLGSGLPALVTSLGVFDDGAGPALYVGGDFTIAGGVPANRIAKWDGQNWHALGEGLNHTASALAVYSDGGEPALYVGGAFTMAGGQPANFIAKWDGTVWTPLGDGVNGVVTELIVFDDGAPDGPALYLGGTFVTSPGGDSYLARYQGCSGGPSCPADWDASGAVNSNDIPAFLTTWLADVQNGTTFADFDRSGSVNSNDISAFLTAWLTAVQFGC